MQVLLVALVLLVWSPPFTQAQDADLAITGVTLIDGTGEAPKEGVTILIQDGVVKRVAPTDEVFVSEDVTVIDGAGKYAIPGLTDMHVHFGRGGGLPNSPQTVEQVLRQFVFYGVTSVLNLGAYYGRADQILELRSRRETGEILAPHIYATGGLLTVPGSHPISRWARFLPDSVDAETHDWSQRGVWVVRTPEGARDVVRRMAAAGMNGIKVVVESDVLVPSVEEESPQMPPAMIRATVEEADDHGLPVIAHVTDRGELIEALDAGVDAVAHLGSQPPALDVLERMNVQGVYLIPTLSLYVQANMWGDPADNLTDPFLRRGVDRRLIERTLASPATPTSAPSEEEWAWRRDFLAAVKAVHDAGVRLVGGSDAPTGVNFHGYNMHHELELLVEAGLTPMEALTTATSRAAEMLGEGDVFGTIEPGQRADVLILAADPLSDIRNTRTLETIILDGRVVDHSSLVQDQ